MRELEINQKGLPMGLMKGRASFKVRDARTEHDYTKKPF